jgi:ABC-2 family transporter protein
MAVAYRSRVRPGRDGFARLLRAEWTKFRTVRRWSLGLVAAALVIVVISVLGASGIHVRAAGASRAPEARGGVPVHDTFRLVHRELRGDGEITVRVASLTSRVEGSAASEPWAKAGVIIKASTRPGSPYVALLSTVGHGVRMQYGYTHDEAVRSGGLLRLTREGALVTGYVSDDGVRWTKVGTVRPAGMPQTVRIGVFAAAPMHAEVHRRFGSTQGVERPSSATAVFDQVGVRGGTAPGWTATTVGEQPGPPGGGPRPVSTSTVSGDTITITGTGDIGPLSGGLDLVGKSLQGALVGLLVMVTLGVLFMTSEYRHGLIRTTFTASPRRGRVLAAKAMVIAAVTFVTSLAALCAAFPLAQAELRAGGARPPGFPHLHLTDATSLRAVAGTAALLAVTAVLALALGAILRHGAGAIAAVIVLVLVPQILVMTLPLTAAQWVQRLTPAAGFAIQQSAPHYAQSPRPCLPEQGCYPLSPWAGLAVPCLYAAVALVVAWWLTRRRAA